ncbi:MAG: hypothetical protein GQ527_01180 [Bacteroidales bacterium]|nr:hypothetical protein [Bacteroidales bacterium]
MKKYLLLFVTVLSFSIILLSCNKDEENEDVVESPDIYGSWLVLQSDSQGVQYHVELKINDNNTYDWILLDSVAGHSSSFAEFTLTEDIMRITVDADCSSVGAYYMIVEANKLAIIAKTEECGPRADALEWVWEKK